MTLTTHNRTELTKQFGLCSVSWWAKETCVITCDIANEHEVKKYMNERGYYVIARRHPAIGSGYVDLNRVTVTGAKELAQ